MSMMTNYDLIDARVLQLRSLINDRGTAEWLNLLAQSIDAYRADVAEGIKGLESRMTDALRMVEEWKRDAGTSEAKLEKAIEERDAYKVQRDGAEIALSKIRKLAEHPDGAGYAKGYATSGDSGGDYVDDPGAPEGDKTVITFECCHVTHFFIPPKFGNWHHESECHECGSKTTFGLV